MLVHLHEKHQGCEMWTDRILTNCDVMFNPFRLFGAAHIGCCLTLPRLFFLFKSFLTLEKEN